MDLITEHPFGPGVMAAFTTRTGGVSQPPYATLNLGLHVGDEEEAVRQNRRLVSQSLGVPCVYMHQTHSNIVRQVETYTDEAIEADALITETVGLGLAVMTADCLPLLMATRRGKVVAAVHCGWRGIYGDIIEHTVLKIRELTQEPLLAWLGPAIGPQSYEVGSELYTRFVDKHATAARCFTKTSSHKYLCSLYGLCTLELNWLGVRSVFALRADTYQQSERFFSYRSEQTTGRMAGIIFKC